MEHLQEQKDAVSEYQKLKQRLILTAEERKVWRILQNKLYKKCTCCGLVKPASEYYSRYSYCKVCKNNKSKVLYYKKRIALYQSKINECQDKIIKLGAKND